MLNADENSRTISTRQYWLVAVSVGGFYAFLTMFHVTAFYYDGMCVYTKWQPVRDTWLSPFGFWVAFVIVLLMWSLVSLIRVLTGRGSAKKWQSLFYCVAILTFAYCGYGLTQFWDFLEFERGAISIEEYSKGMPHSVMRTVECTSI